MFIEKNYDFNEICNIFHVLIIDKSEGRMHAYVYSTSTVYMYAYMYYVCI